MDREERQSGGEGGFAGRVLLVAGVVLLLLLLWMWRSVLLLVFASVLIAVGLHGLAKPISRRLRLRKSLALGLAGVVVLAALTGIGWLFGAQIGAQITELQTRLPQALEALRSWADTNPIGRQASQQLEAANGNGGFMSVLARSLGWTLTFASAALDLLVVVVAGIFLAIDPDAYRNGFLKLVAPRFRGEAAGALDDCAHALRKWLLGTLISMTAVAVLVGVALFFLNVPAYLALALIAGLAQFVPLVGPLFAALPGVLLALTVGVDTALWTGLAYFAVSQIEANLLTPLIQKRAVSLPPALTLFAILAMGLLLGPLGVLFAVPLTVVIAILTVRLYVKRVLHESDVATPGR